LTPLKAICTRHGTAPTGATIELIHPGSFDVLKKIVASSVPKKFEELNIRALEAGHQYYRDHQPD